MDRNEVINTLNAQILTVQGGLNAEEKQYLEKWEGMTNAERAVTVAAITEYSGELRGLRHALRLIEGMFIG